MYELSKVKELEAKSNEALALMRRLADALAGRVDVYQADTSRSESFNQERIQKARDEALPAISEQHKIITEIAKELQTQEPFYESKPFILSFQTFNDDDPAKDAAIRMNVGRELAAMPLALLRLAIDSAAADKDLPMFYQGFLTANARNNEFREAGGMEVDLDAIDVPDQLEGIAAISQAWGNMHAAEFPLVDAIGARVSPSKRLVNINDRDEALKRSNDARTAAAAATAARAGI